MSNPRDLLLRNAQAIEERLSAACRVAGRPRHEIRVVAVTKYVAPDVAIPLRDFGLHIWGESRPQELWRKAAAVTGIEWHLIGHLQRNKIDKTLPLVSLIHSVDSIRLLNALEAEGAKQQRDVAVLLEVHLSGEASKQGFAPADLAPLMARLAELRRVRVQGLMTMAAEHADPATARHTFAQLRHLRDQLQAHVPAPHDLRELSMGMTRDFPEAVAEGATLVRIGSAYFDGLIQES
jgi:pyridoxal phosphate enzyme (YggS family)